MRLSRGLPVVVLLITLVAVGLHAAAEPAAPGIPILERYLALGDPDPTDFRVLRHIDARSERLGKTAWMDVWTEADQAGFRYRIVGEGGSEYIRSKVFRASLETEQTMWAAGTPDRAALTPANYLFSDGGVQPNGLAALIVKPRRTDDLMIDGRMYLSPGDGDLVRLEGRLVKSPSFWTRRVEIVRLYRRFAGVRMPIALESVANVLVAGTSTFRVTYEYETVNGHRFGTPQLRAANNDQLR